MKTLKNKLEEPIGRCLTHLYEKDCPHIDVLEEITEEITDITNVCMIAQII